MDLENTEKPEIKRPISIGSYKKQEIPGKKASTSASLTKLKPMTM